MLTVFKLAGDTPEQAAEEAKNVLDIETALAKGSTSRTELRDPEKRYHPMEVTALEGLAPDFDWKLYFTSIDESQLTNLNVGMPDFFKAMDQVITSSSLPQLKSYLRLHIINGNAPWLSDNFYQAHFNFFSHELSGAGFTNTAVEALHPVLPTRTSVKRSDRTGSSSTSRRSRKPTWKSLLRRSRSPLPRTFKRCRG